METLGYRSNPDLRSKLDGVVRIDRGYHIPSVIKLFTDMHCGFLGTHSEKVAKWPYCSSSLSETRKDQTYVPIHGARCSFVSERKFVQKHTYAIMYRSGCKGIGNIHTTVPEADVWVMEDYSPSTTIEIICWFRGDLASKYI